MFFLDREEGERIKFVWINLSKATDGKVESHLGEEWDGIEVWFVGIEIDKK